VTAPTNGTELMGMFLPASPFVGRLGVQVVHLGDGGSKLRLPWDPANTTIGDLVHGGAIAALVDMTIMTTAWCGAKLPDNWRGVTVSMAVQYLAPAHSTDLISQGVVRRRGRSLVNVDVSVADSVGNAIASALGTYKIG
jgi:uncharacterized protein (TIGR00369 family)